MSALPTRVGSATWQIPLAIVATVIGALLVGYIAAQIFFLPDTLAQGRIDRVPNLGQMAIEQARDKAESEGYVVAVGGERRSDDVEAGRVIYQLPPPGFYRPRGDTVWVLVSRGTEPTVLPDLAGLEPELGEEILSRLGLAITPSRQKPSELHPWGTIAETVPPAGTEIEPGVEVTMVISQGGTLVEMPDVRGLPLRAARDTLVAYGITVGQVGSLSADQQGIDGPTVVTGQQPRPGQHVHTGSAARLELGRVAP
jgi:beta-lactam-binding protein with PASTA domain